MKREDKLDFILKDATEPRPPEGYWEEMKKSVMRKTRAAAPQRRPGRVVAFFKWSAAAAAMVLLTFICIHLYQMRDMMSRQGPGWGDATVLHVVRLEPADVRHHSAAAMEIDRFLEGRAMVVATDGAKAELQTNGSWRAAHTSPTIVRFAVFQRTETEAILISSPTIAILRGNEVSIRFRAQQESLSVEYECYDIEVGAKGILLPCRVSVISASGRKCEVKGSPYLHRGAVSKIGSVTAGDVTYEVYVGYPEEIPEDETSRT
jgi:hypothetical protein